MKDASLPTQDTAAGRKRGALRRKRLLWIVGGLLLLATAYVLNDRRPWETRYQGKSVKHWLGALQSHTRSEREEAQAALLEIGPAAAPGLFKIVNQDRRSIDNDYMKVRRELPDVIADFFPRRTGKIDGRKLAEEAFLAMGPAAESTLPLIRKALADVDSPAHVFAFEVYKSIQPHDRKSIEALIDAWSAESKKYPRNFFRENDRANSSAFLALRFTLKENPEIWSYSAPKLVRSLAAEWDQGGTNYVYQTRILELLGDLPPDNPTAPAARELLGKFTRSKSKPVSILAQLRLSERSTTVSPRERSETLAKFLRSKDPVVLKAALSHFSGEYTPESPHGAIIAAALIELMERQGGQPRRRVHMIGKLGTDAAAAVPLLTKLASEGDPSDRWFAVRAVWQITRDPDVVLALVMETSMSTNATAWKLRGRYTAGLLWDMGPSAAQAAAALRKELETAEKGDRYRIAGALWSVSGDAEPLLSMLLYWSREFNSRPKSYYTPELLHDYFSELSHLVETAGKVGPAASPLVPELIKSLHHPYQRRYTMKRILEALQKIDPAALDQVDPEILAEFLPRIDLQAKAD